MAKTIGKVVMNFEATEKQREYVKYLAGLHGLSQAEYIRMRVLSDPIERWG